VRDRRGRRRSLHIQETGGAVEIEIEFALIEEVKGGYVVLAKAKVLECGLEIGGRDEEVREYDHQGALADFLRGLVEGREQRGAAIRAQIGETVEDLAEVGRAAPGGNLHRLGASEAPKAPEAP